jgi:hypothetical protein
MPIMQRDLAPSEPVLRLSGTEPIAVGHLRSVYQHPHRASELIKVMRADAIEKRWNAPNRWAKRLPRARHYVQYLRELKEFVVARARAPDIDVPIARMLGVVDTDLGLGLVSEKVVDANGALAPTLADVYAKRGFTPELDAALAKFSADLLAANTIVGDMHAWNIVYGSDSRGGPRLVMIDGFGEKHAIPVSSVSRAINRYRTKRLLKRMVEQVKELVPVGSEG